MDVDMKVIPVPIGCPAWNEDQSKGRRQQPGQRFSVNAIGIQTENLVVIDKRPVGAIVVVVPTFTGLSSVITIILSRKNPKTNHRP